MPRPAMTKTPTARLVLRVRGAIRHRLLELRAAAAGEGDLGDAGAAALMDLARMVRHRSATSLWTAGRRLVSSLRLCLRHLRRRLRARGPACRRRLPRSSPRDSSALAPVGATLDRSHSRVVLWASTAAMQFPLLRLPLSLSPLRAAFLGVNGLLRRPCRCAISAIACRATGQPCLLLIASCLGTGSSPTSAVLLRLPLFALPPCPCWPLRANPARPCLARLQCMRLHRHLRRGRPSTC
jgi:hypothetical protein